MGSLESTNNSLGRFSWPEIFVRFQCTPLLDLGLVCARKPPAFWTCIPTQVCIPEAAFRPVSGKVRRTLRPAWRKR